MDYCVVESFFKGACLFSPFKNTASNAPSRLLFTFSSSSFEVFLKLLIMSIVLQDLYIISIGAPLKLPFKNSTNKYMMV